MIYPSAKLGSFLRHRAEFALIDDTENYKRLRVQLHGKGIVLRDETSGVSLKTKKQQIARAGDFLVAEIDAKVGGFGIVPALLDGAIASSHYFLFEINESVCLSGWLDTFIRSGRLEEQVAARGSTNYAAIRPGQVLEFEIPLPPLLEQRRIVARVQQIDERVREARELRANAENESARLLTVMAHRLDLDDQTKRRMGWAEVSLGDVVRQVQDRHRVATDGVYPNLGILSFGRGLFEKVPIEGARTSARELNRVGAGQFIYSRLFAFEGAYGMVGTKFDGYFVSNEYPTFECDQARVTPEFLEAYFRLPVVWADVAMGSKGLGHRRQRVQPGLVLSHRVMLPPLSAQRRIRDVRRLLDRLRVLQNRAATELDVVLASVLHRNVARDRGRYARETAGLEA